MCRRFEKSRGLLTMALKATARGDKPTGRWRLAICRTNLATGSAVTATDRNEFTTARWNPAAGRFDSMLTVVVVVRLPLRGFGDDFFRRVARHFLVVAEGLGVDASPAG